MTMTHLLRLASEQRPRPRFLDGPEKRLLIGGDWIPAATGETLTAIDPTTELPLASFAAAGDADVDKAVAAARRAFEAPAWSRMSPYERSRILLRIADAVEAHADELSTLDSLDMGAPKPLTRWMAEHAAEIFRYYAGWPTKLYGDTAPSAPSMFNYTLRQPLGVVAGISAWNGPILQLSWKIAPALAAGNTVVFKPAENSSLSALRFAELLQELDLPPGIVNLITGLGTVAGEALINHPDVDKVTFTGSTRVGKHILDVSQGNLKRVTLELGGKSPNIIFADADLPAAAAAAAAAFCAGSGQGCVAGTRIFVHDSVREEFSALLVEELKKYTLGDPFHPDTRMGPLASREHFTRVVSYFDVARREGASVRLGGELPAGSGLFVPPTLIDGATNSMRVAREEIFGPVAAIMSFTDEADAVNLANDTDYGLAAAIWTKDLARTHRVSAALRAGTVWVNTYAAMTDGTVPFGGFKQSGIGREHGASALDAFTETKTVMVNLA